MTDDSISTLYRKACPSCARQYARDSRACPYCGYVDTLTSETEEDQERLYGEYLMARYKQCHDEVERLRRELALHPQDRARDRALALAVADWQGVKRELDAYRDGRDRVIEEPPQRAAGNKEYPVRTAPLPIAEEPPQRAVGDKPYPVRTAPLPVVEEPPQRAVGDKECPVCTATLPNTVSRCACGFVFGAEVIPAVTLCPHCTATVAPGAHRCGCGYILAATAPAAGIPGLRRR